MDKNLPNDPLEEFFKKSLKGENELPSDDGWDVPSSDVWDRVEEKMQPETTVRVINYWKWTAVAASIVILFFGYQWMEQRQEIEQLNTALEEKKEKENSTKDLLENSNEERIVTTENKNNHTTDNHQSTDASSSELENQEVVSTDKSKLSNEATSFSGENKNGIGGRNNDGTPIIPNSKTENIASENFNNSPVVFPNKNKTVVDDKNEFLQNSSTLNFSKTNSDNSNNEFFEKETAASVERVIQEVEILPNRNFPIEFFKLKETEISPSSFRTMDFSGIEFKPRFYVGAFASKNLGTRHIVGRNTTDRKNILRDSRKKEFWTMGGGVKVGYQFHKNWSVETGIQYTKMEAGSSHKINRKFKTTGEVMVGSEFQNDYALLIVTSFGDIESDVTLSRNNPIADQTPFQVKVDSRQNITFLELPLVVKYKLQKGKFSLGFKAGAMTRFVLDSDIEIETITAQSPLLSFRRYEVGDKREIKNLKPATFDFTAGIEAEFQLTKSATISFEPSFSRSLTPVFEKENVKTYPMITNMKLGVNYYF